MYKNKKDVDKYVEKLSAKVTSQEFKTRAYSIARLYFDVGDYVNCQKYVEQYLTQKDNNAAAYRLLAQALQKLGQKDKALEQYETSFDIDPASTTTIRDICELLLDDDIDIKSARAKYWCEKAEATFPKHPITFRLREKLVTMSNPDPEALVNLLTAELSASPKDPTLHIRLLKHYINVNKVNEAFDHCCSVEFSKDNFSNNLSWYEALDDVIKHYSGHSNNWLYQLLTLTVKERLCLLSLTETHEISKNVVQICDLLYDYDQTLDGVAKAGPENGLAEFHAGLLQHHRGQFSFHVATFILKKAKKDQLNWREASKLASPLMLVAWQTVPLDVKVNWLKLAPEKQLTAVYRWYTEGTYRCSQSGHFLIINYQDKSQSFLDQVSQSCSGTHWKDKLYKSIFANESLWSKTNTSFLMSNAFVAPILRLPRKIEVIAYDEDAQRQYGNSLHHFVWMLLNYTDYADFKCSLFDMLKPTTASSGPETLNKYDIYAFLICATLTAQQQKGNKFSYAAADKLSVIPANITDLLCTSSQMKWWDCAYKFSQNVLGSELTDIRVTLSRGIEVVRCIDNHSLDPVLLCTLGRLFSELAKKTTLIEEKMYLQKRANLYYSSAIPILDKLKNKMMIKICEKRLFDYTHKELSSKELNSIIEESKLYVAGNFLQDNEYDKAIEMLTNVKTPQAYYQLALTFKQIASEEKNSSASSFSSKQAALLEKAKKYAYKALNDLKETQSFKSNPLYSDTQELLGDIEIHINKIDLDTSDNNYVESTKYSSDENELYQTDQIRIKSNLFRNVSSTPKTKQNQNNTNYRTAIDSQILEMTRVDQQHLERIESEIKNLQKRDTIINDFMDQTKLWFEENKNLGNKIISTINSNIQNTTDQFKQLKISVDQVKDQIDECRNECKDVGDLKKQIAELKKEVNKLKKSEHAIDESDMYGLEEEYRNTENTPNYAAQLPFASQMLPNFNQRPPFPIPPNPYQLYNQTLYNLFNQYTQFPQASTVPGASQLFDAARAQLNYPGVYPTPDQMYLDVAHLIPPTVPAAPTIPVATSVPAVPVVPSLPIVSTLPTVAPISAPTLATSASTFKTSTSTDSSKDVARSLPVNVVITSSDPLPTCVSAPAPVLSVTIPQKHIKGTPHNYQIQMPTTSEPKVSPPVFTFTMPESKSNSTNPTSSMWKQTFQTNKDEAYKLQFPVYGQNTSSDNSKTVVDGPFSASPNTSLNKSRTLSEKSNTSVENYDPCPDFKPIVPLPAEVKVTTGEEDETAIFSSRAKLYRFVNKEWKERGLGVMKLLKHNNTGKVRVLMRREQVHKICANHVITPDMEINQMMNETKAYIWVANDFADETFTLETFCIRFKTADIAKSFYDAFVKARSEAVSPNTSLTESKSNDKKPISNNKQETVSSTNKEVVSSQPGAPVNEAPQSLVSAPGKTVVGGFTFSSTPIFKPVDNTNDKTEISKTESEKPKTNIFTGISLKTNTTTPFSGFTFNTTSNEPKTEVNIDTNKSKLNTSDTVEEFEPTIEFKPVVPLPALIDPKTGEENENILFEHRAKLLRFDSSNKEWKERGLGNIKLLVNKDNNQKVRLLMRREQIMKVCCNHSVTKEMTFQKMPNMDKAVTWCAKDFSEGDLVSETFCLRFKTVQLCNDFMEAIKSAQNKITDETKAAKEEQNAAKQSNTATAAGWGDKFKPKPGSWECQCCFVRNESQNDNCSACNSSKDPTAKPNTTVKPTEQPKFLFGIPAQKVEAPVQIKDSTNKPATTGFGDKFKPKEGSWECKQCFVRNDATSENCCACNSSKDPNAPKDKPSGGFGSASSVKFRFGIPPASTNEEPKPVPSIFDGSGAQKFSFGIPANTPANTTDEKSSEQKYTAVLFAAPKATQNEQPLNFSQKTNTDTSKPEAKPILQQSAQPESSSVLGTKDSSSFGFVFKPSTASKSPAKSPRSQGDESDGDDYVKEEDCHAHFNPVIPMPDKVEVITGEENESELYAHRARLYRFISVEWKERGTGVVKILRHNETNKLRVVMRREQVLKICLNHALTPDITYTPKDEKTWLFSANDFSEGELNLQHFCLRFTNKEIALQFKAAIDSALQNISTSTEQSTVKTTENKDQKDDDVVFVSETHASADEQMKAKELMLPENFYTYKNKDPCQGCRGCDDDDLKTTKCQTAQALEPIATSSPASTAVTTPVKATTSTFMSPTTSLYGTPGNSEKTFDNSIFRTPLGSIGANTQSMTPTNSSGDASTINTTNKENIFTQKSNLFTNFGEQKSIFGTPQGTSPSLFGTSESQASITTKSSVLAPPKLSTLNTSTDKPETKPLSNAAKPAASETGSIFANPAVTTNKFTFGNSSNDATKNTTQPESKSIFSNNFQATGNLFTGNTQGSIFGTGIFSNNNTKPESGSIFSSALNQNTSNVFKSIFSKPTDTNSIWSSNSSTDVKSDNSGPLAKKEAETVKEPETQEPLFIKADFADFAALSTSEPGFQKKTDFQWEGAGQQLFTSKGKQDGDKSKNESGAADESGAGDEEYDPHYEPIVPLPDKIVVTTGEEDEEKIFAERCKLFRFDYNTKEWKERGVGEMKVLYHPARNTYRLLLRREQVFKAVLNMLMYTDLELLPMKNSDRAWTWVGKNYAEVADGEQEMLAVRFKNVELANKFHEQVTQCVRKLQASAAKAIREEKEAAEAQPEIKPLRLPKHLADSARADSLISASVKTPQGAPVAEAVPKPNGEATQAADNKQVHFQEPEEEQEHEEYDEDEEYGHEYDDQNDYDGYYNEEDDENGPFYSCDGEAVVKQGVVETTCANAHIQVMFDQEIYSPKILVTDSNTGEILADMLIHTDTEFQMSGDSCMWTGIDYTTNEPVDKTITVNFYDNDTAMQFYDSCETSKAATYSSNDPEC